MASKKSSEKFKDVKKKLRLPESSNPSSSNDHNDDDDFVLPVEKDKIRRTVATRSRKRRRKEADVDLSVDENSEVITVSFLSSQLLLQLYYPFFATCLLTYSIFMFASTE